MNFPEMDEQHDEQPKGTWKAEQVIEYFIEHFSRGDFLYHLPGWNGHLRNRRKAYNLGL